MKAILELITSNPLLSTLIGTTIVAAFGGLWRWRRDRRDGDAIYKFMLDSKSRTDLDFRTTPAIASHTHLPAERVTALCARHPKIRRNEKEKESWTLVG